MSLSVASCMCMREYSVYLFSLSRPRFFRLGSAVFGGFAFRFLFEFVHVGDWVVQYVVRSGVCL